MRKALGALAVLLLAAVVVAAVLLLPAPVPESNPALEVPNEFPTITAAMGAASEGDTILVSPGTYRENVAVNKSVAVRASVPGAAVLLPPDPTDPGFNITADGASVSGFAIRGTTARSLGTQPGWVPYSIYDNAAIWVHNARDVSVRDNTIEDNGVGIEVYSNGVRDTRGLRIEGNTIRNTTWTGTLLAHDTRFGVGGLVANNTIEGTGHHGMWANFLSGGTFAHNVVRDAAMVALVLDASEHVDVDGLQAEDVWQGLSIHDVSRHHVVRGLEVLSLSWSTPKSAALNVSFESGDTRIVGLHLRDMPIRIYDSSEATLEEPALTNVTLYLGLEQLPEATNGLAVESPSGTLVSHGNTTYVVDAGGTHFLETLTSAVPRLTRLDTLPATIRTTAPLTASRTIWSGGDVPPGAAVLELDIDPGPAGFTLSLEALQAGRAYSLEVDGAVVAQGTADAEARLTFAVTWGSHARLRVVG